jgi:hypothetical protein
MVACAEAPMSEETDDFILASAYGIPLYNSDVRKAIPKSSIKQDSASLVQNYINKWIQQQVMLHNAKENLTPEEQDFSAQMEDYRNSLLLYTYERKLINLNLDTTVNDDEIEAYYMDNREQFELKGNIVKFDYVKIPRESGQARDVRNMLRPGIERDSLALMEYCQRYSTDYWLAEDWVFLQDLLETIPLEIDNEENFLRRTTFTETRDDEYIFMLRINDFKTTDSIPPLVFEKENIRNIIINSRKLELLERLRQKDIDEAFSNKAAEIYKKPVIQ